MRALLAIALAVLLSGCWDGDALYVATDARPAITPGLYRMMQEGDDGPSAVLRVSMLPDGMTRVAAEPGGPRDHIVMGFAPLEADGRSFAVWTVPSGVNEGGDQVTFGLLRRADHGRYVYIVPQCDRTLAIASAAGATLRGRDALGCRFTSRASLEGALRALPANAETHGDVVRLEPVSG